MMYFCENSPNPCVAGVAQEGFFSVTRAPFTAIPATHGQHWHLLNTVGQPFFSFVFLVLKSILETANAVNLMILEAAHTSYQHCHAPSIMAATSFMHTCNLADFGPLWNRCQLCEHACAELACCPARFFLFWLSNQSLEWFSAGHILYNTVTDACIACISSGFPERSRV